MKLLISVLACFCVLHVNGQFSLSRFLSSICQSSQNRNNPACQSHLPSPPPSTTATTNAITTKPTTRFVPTTIIRRPPPRRKPCVQRGQCSDGVFLADAFAANFLSASSTNNSNSGARGKRQIPQSVIQKKDLAILMDESGSIGENGFDQIKQIAAGIIRVLCYDIRVHPLRTRVALTSFDSQVHHHRDLISQKNFEHNYDGNATADWIGPNIRYNSTTHGRTCLIDALNYVADTVLSSRLGGRREKTNVVQTILLITDGCENCRSNPQEVMRNLRNKFLNININMYIIGIGVSNRCQDMLNVLSQRGRCFEHFYLEDYLQVTTFLDALKTLPEGVCYGSFKLPTDTQCSYDISGSGMLFQ